MNPLLVGLWLMAGGGAAGGGAAGDSWQVAEENARQSQRAITFCCRYAHGWLAHADPTTGLLPRTVKGDAYWNAKDCAADNYPFIVLTACVTDQYYLKQIARSILDQEQRLTNRLDRLPDDFLFSTQKFRTETYKLDDLIFGAAEYAKDGLIPVTEWLGPGPWLERAKGLIVDIWKHAPHESDVGRLPSRSVEVNGDLLQTMSRLYWLTGDEQFKTWAFRLADHYLLHENLLEGDSVRLRDHGCEIIGGLSEAYVIAAVEDPDRRQRYRPQMHAILERILQFGVNEDGFMYNGFNPRTGEKAKGYSDGWGYVYNAFLTVAQIDGEPRFREAVARTLSNIHKYRVGEWEGWGTVDDYADSVEGGINLLNRIPVESAFAWVDSEMHAILDRQRPDGILEGWHGDGNSTRTALMYALWKTQGITLAPWREDMQLGAVREPDGSLKVFLRSEWPWTGRLRCDRPRHRDHFHMPIDYPRINQMPEWFTVERRSQYEVQPEGGPVRLVSGAALLSYEFSLEAGKPVRLTIVPRLDQAAAALRTMKYSPRSRDEAAAWQKQLRASLRALLKLDDLVGATIPLDVKAGSPQDKGDYILREMEISSTPQRRIKLVLTAPRAGPPPHPAVVCIHGHGGSRHVVYDPSSIYRGFADALARRGFVTVAADVGQHEVFEPNRTLMGERLWDLMRCVDLLRTLPQVDPSRIGCAGLSLGGEMAMWLGAMDERIAATVSSGFLTVMDQMEQDHCMCWKLEGLRELVDFADIYSLIAPRALQCQNGLAEPPDAFIVPLARQAWREIQVIYRDFGAPCAVTPAVHPEGHVIDLPSLLSFFEAQLGTPAPGATAPAATQPGKGRTGP